MKKSIILSIAAAAAFATAAFTANTVSADTTDPATDATTSTTVSSDGQEHYAKITLTAGANSKGTGDIILTAAPDFDFGSKTLDEAAKGISISPDTAITVENPGVAAGWHVTSTLGDFTGDNGTLKGATLELTKIDVANTTAATTGVSLPAATTTTLNKGAQTVLAATADAEKGAFQGVGTTTGKTTATLTVPAGNVEGTYTAPLTWTLAADPTNDNK